MWPVTSHVYKRATKPGLSTGTICTQPNGRKHKTLYFMEHLLSNFYQLLIWWKGAHLSFYFHNSWIYVEIMTQNVNFPIWPVQYLACQTSQRMCKVTLIVNKVHMVYTQRILHCNFRTEFQIPPTNLENTNFFQCVLIIYIFLVMNQDLFHLKC